MVSLVCPLEVSLLSGWEDSRGLGWRSELGSQQQLDPGDHPHFNDEQRETRLLRKVIKP